MYDPNPLTGASLPPKTLCLTYDDGPGATRGAGPGPHTLELAQYLNQQGIRATFFVVGKYAVEHPDILRQLKSLGHLVANHTFEHPNLVDYLAAGGDLFDQVARTDAVIKNWIDGPTTYFRPPYYVWSPEVAKALNDSLAACLNHVGPIVGTIDSRDWECWLNGVSVGECAERCLIDIRQQNRGIILMHDSSADLDVIQKANMTLELTQLLVPILKQDMYEFVRLDEIDEIRSAAQVPLQFALLASNGKYVSLQGEGGTEIMVNRPAAAGLWSLQAEDLGHGKIAIKAPNGLYFSPQDGGGREVLANAPAIGEWEALDLITVEPRRVAFRTIKGYFLGRESAGGRLMAEKTSMRDSEIFTFENLSARG